MNNLATQIQQGPHWQFFFHPLAPLQETLRLDTLVKLVKDHAVRLRGWHYPHLDPNELERHADGISCGIAFRELVEYWKYFRSGQFISLFSFIEDKLGACHQCVLYADIALLRITECLKFAAGVSSESVYEKGIHIELMATGCQGRALELYDRPVFNFLSQLYRRCESDEPLAWSIDVSPSELQARHAELALDAAMSIMEVFGDVTSLRPYLAGEQAKFLRGDLRF